jgi:hypothetical protein
VKIEIYVSGDLEEAATERGCQPAFDMTVNIKGMKSVKVDARTDWILSNIIWKDVIQPAASRLKEPTLRHEGLTGRNAGKGVQRAKVKGIVSLNDVDTSGT